MYDKSKPRGLVCVFFSFFFFPTFAKPHLFVYWSGKGTTGSTLTCGLFRRRQPPRLVLNPRRTPDGDNRRSIATHKISQFVLHTASYHYIPLLPDPHMDPLSISASVVALAGAAASALAGVQKLRDLPGASDELLWVMNEVYIPYIYLHELK